MSKKHIKNDIHSPMKRKLMRFAKRAVEMIFPLGSFYIIVFALYSFLNSEFLAAIVRSSESYVHAVMSDRLREKNKSAWWRVVEANGNYYHSNDAEQNCTAREWVREFCKLCKLKVVVKNKNKIPKSRKLVVIANHDNTDAGRFIAAIIDDARQSNTSRVLASSADTKNIYMNLVRQHSLVAGAEDKINTHLQSGAPLIIFPKTSDFYTAKQDRTLPRFRFMDGFLRFAIQNESDILPVKVHLDYPFWWRLLWFIVPFDVANAILETFKYHIYQNTTLHITIGDVIPHSKIKQDASSAYTKRGKTRYPDEVVAKYEHAIMGLR